MRVLTREAPLYSLDVREEEGTTDDEQDYPTRSALHEKVQRIQDAMPID